MTLSELTLREIIDLVGAIFFRITGFTYLVAALSNAWHLEEDANYSHELHSTASHYDLHVQQLLMMDLIYNLVFAALMFLLPIALTRLVCRGLETALAARRTKQSP